MWTIGFRLPSPKTNQSVGTFYQVFEYDGNGKTKFERKTRLSKASVLRFAGVIVFVYVIIAYF